MTVVLVAAALLVLGGMALTLGIVRMADKPAPKPPLRLVSSEWEAMDLQVIDELERTLTFDADEHLNFWSERPTTDERGLQ